MITILLEKLYSEAVDERSMQLQSHSRKRKRGCSPPYFGRTLLHSGSFPERTIGKSGRILPHLRLLHRLVCNLLDDAEDHDE